MENDELLTVVDSNDKVIGSRKRSECHRDKSFIHRVSLVAVFSGNRILVQKRNTRKDMFPGFYTVSASGHVAWGEEYDQAAFREMKEEIGIEAKPEFCGKKLVDSGMETEMAAVFRCLHDGPYRPNRDEVDGLELMGPEEVRRFLPKFTPCAKAALSILSFI